MRVCRTAAAIRSRHVTSVPAKFGLARNYITFASNYGDKSEYWQGFDVTMTARPTANLTISGGTSTGQFTVDNCEIVEQLPEMFVLLNRPLDFCRVEEPLLTNLKMFGSYILPRIDVQLSGTFQSLPGPQLAAEYTVLNAVAAPLLGRPLSGNAANATVNIVEAGDLYGDRRNQLDLRVAKIFRVNQSRLTAGIDIANVLNANPVLAETAAYRFVARAAGDPDRAVRQVLSEPGLLTPRARRHAGAPAPS